MCQQETDRVKMSDRELIALAGLLAHQAVEDIAKCVDRYVFAQLDSPRLKYQMEQEAKRWAALTPKQQCAELRHEKWQVIKRKLLWPWRWIEALVLYGVRGRQEEDD